MWAQADVRQGAMLFRQDCVPCHGAAARGGMRGPDLTTGQWVHGGSDADLSRSISQGVPGTAMPGNNLTDNELRDIVAYLRTLQRSAASSRGDVRHGESMFFGALRCFSCHMVNGRGGRLGPELSQVGSARPRDYLIESIREPDRQLTAVLDLGDPMAAFGIPVLSFDTVTAVTRSGKTIVGVPMNEDTFTLQIIDAGENVYSLDKKSLKSLRHDARSLMPPYGPDKLNAADLEDLLAYLISLRAPTPAAESGAPHVDR